MSKTTPVSNDRIQARFRWEFAWFSVNVHAIIFLAVFFRLWQLDHVPGINGDEAWYGVQVMKFVRGEHVAWRTPTGNPLNPFFVLPLLGLHLAFAPSYLLLRVPAVVSGLLALPVNFWLCRRTFDRRTAWLTTLLLAVLPINVAYCRFGWDASQTVLATLPVCYCALLAVKEPHGSSWWLGWSAASLVCAIVVHPTNIFLAPVPLCSFVLIRKDRLLKSCRTQLIGKRRATIVAGAVLCGAAIGWLAKHWIVVACARLLALDQYGEFVVNFLRLFNGMTTYRYIAGSKMPAGWIDFDPLDGLAWCLLIVAALGLADAGRRSSQPLITCLACGWGLTLLGFFLIAGPQAITPHYERYGLVLIAPTTILLCIGLGEWLSRPDFLRRVATNSLLASAWVLILGVGVQYFVFIRQTGGESHLTFRTGATEPKLAAFEQMTSERNGDNEIWLAVDDYWNLHPLAYLALGQHNVHVATLATAMEDAEFHRSVRERRAWLVGFAGARWWHEGVPQLHESGMTPRFLARDYAGRPVVRLEKIGEYPPFETAD